MSKHKKSFAATKMSLQTPLKSANSLKHGPLYSLDYRFSREKPTLNKVNITEARKLIKLGFNIDSLQCKMKFERETSTPAEQYKFYQQYAFGYPITGGWTRLDLCAQTQALHGVQSRMYCDKTLARVDKKLRDRKPISERVAIRFLKSSRLYCEGMNVVDTGLCLKQRGNTPVLCWKITATGEGLPSVRYYLDATTGKILDHKRLTFGAAGTVFYPSPAIKIADFSLKPNNVIPSLAFSRFALNRLDGSGFLRGDFANAISLGGRARSNVLEFHYAESDTRFGETMAYLYATWIQEYIQSLGFFKANPGQVKFIVDYYQNADNSEYDSFSNTVRLGLGSVPDYQDAEVIVHEYSHSLHCKVNAAFGLDKLSLHLAEGFCDYMALTAFAEAKPPEVKTKFASWDASAQSAPNQISCLREVRDNLKLSDVFDGTIPTARNDRLSEFWTSVLWDIRRALGAMRADCLALAHFYIISPPFGFREGAEAILRYNSTHFERRDEDRLLEIFRNRGIL